MENNAFTSFYRIYNYNFFFKFSHGFLSFRRRVRLLISASLSVNTAPLKLKDTFLLAAFSATCRDLP